MLPKKYEFQIAREDKRWRKEVRRRRKIKKRKVVRKIRPNKINVKARAVADTYAEKLKNKATPQEKILLDFLSTVEADFQFQHPIFINENKFYIIDFYFPNKKMAVELDGFYHTLGEYMKKDIERDRCLSEMGIKTIRIQNKMVTGNFLDIYGLLRTFGIINKIK